MSDRRADRPASVAFRTLGCKVNQVESEDVAAELIGRGVRIVAEADADIIIINTCTVTGEADSKARKAVRQSLAAQRSPVVVVTGCLASVDAAALEALGKRVVVEPDKVALAERVADMLGAGHHEPVAGQPGTGDHEPVAGQPDAGGSDAGDSASGQPASRAPSPRTPRSRSRVQVKVQDGCDCFCTYCIVPAARGLPRSVSVDDVVSRVGDLVSSGVSEVVLTGINLGRYADGGTGLAGLIEAVAATGVARLRLSSIEPLHIDDSLLATLAATPSFCRHLHVPMQSGANAVLSAMGRGYTAAQFEDRIEAARAALPGLAVSTDVIAGFPGESADDAEATLRFVERIGFSRLHVFRYSARTGTAAADMPGQIAPTVRAARAESLREADSRLRHAHADSFVGTRVEVLVERLDGGVAVGTTREYATARVHDVPEAVIGTVIEVHVHAHDNGVLLAAKAGDISAP